jgi:flagellar hook-associated protein 3 FlgL
MRITNSMMLSSMMRNMNMNLNKMSKTEQMLATGKKFSMPSDDPIGVSRSLRLHTDVANMEQYKRNAEDALSWLETTETAINNMINVFQRAKELTVQAASETNSEDERRTIALEIEQLKNQIIGIANTTYAGSYIFSGFKTNMPLLDKETGNYFIQTDPATSPAPILTKNEKIEFNVGIGDRIEINILPQRIFGAGNDVDGPINTSADIQNGDQSQLIAVFEQLYNDLMGNNTEGISAGLTRLEAHFDNLNAVRSEIGVKTNRMELTLSKIDSDTLNLKNLLSKNEDADIAEVIMNLKMQESVYQASLAGGARIIQPTLIDFLR